VSTRKINVISSRPLHSGETNGKPWSIYEIVATTPEGEPIDLTLKSFDQLDGLVEVEVEKQEHEKYGTSYMLKRAGGGGQSAGARLGPKVDELRDRLERLESIVTRLVEEGNGLRALARPPAAAAPGYAPPEPTFGPDDDIPF
jgi:hypothetical protein